MDPINLRYLNILEVTVNMGYTRWKKKLGASQARLNICFFSNSCIKYPFFTNFPSDFSTST